MNKQLHRYSEYKDSGIPWFGKVPAHWQLIRLGHVLAARGELNKDGNTTKILSVLRGRGVIPYEDKGNIGNKRSEDITRYKIVRPNDIVVNSMNVIIGSVGRSQYTGCLSPVYYVLRTRSDEDAPEYYDAVFQTQSFQKSLIRIGYGILAHRMRIPLHLLRREFIPRPPAEEQKAIAAYLRVAEKRINRFIRNRQKLIERLNEQKQAIINRAVTRGLDPNARLIPSGVDWLGDVPEYWEVRRIRNCLEDTKIGLWGDEPTPHNRDDHVTCVRVADFDMRNWGVSTTKLTTRAIPKHLQPSRLLQEGDLLMEKSGGGGRRAGRPGCDVQPQTLSSIFKLYLAPPAK